MTKQDFEVLDLGTDMSFFYLPMPAHEAAEWMKKSGNAVMHRARIMECLCVRSGVTLAELAGVAELGCFESQNLVSDLVAAGLVEHGFRRKCRVDGSLAPQIYLSKTGALVMGVQHSNPAAA